MVIRRLARALAAHWVGAVLVALVVALGGAVLTLLGSDTDSGHPIRNLVGALVLAVVLGAGYAVVRTLVGPRTSSTLEQRFGLPVVGVLPSSDHFARTAVHRGAPTSGATTSGADAVGNLHDNVVSRWPGGQPRVLVVTSPERRAGRSTVAIHLALATASTGRRAVLVDADLEHPTIAARFGVGGRAGLVEVLARRAEVAEVLQRPAVDERLSILASGSPSRDPSGLVASESLRSLIAGLARVAYVVVDAPPLLPVPGAAAGARTGAAELAACADGVLVVLSAGDTQDNQVHSALRLLRATTRRTALGFVVNRAGRNPGYRPVG